MKIKLISIALIAAACVIILSDTVSAADWMFKPSYFSHDPATGARVTQYAAKPPVYATAQPVYQKSGYHRSWSVLRDRNGGYDLYHINNEWGRYATPYYYGWHHWGPYSRSRAMW